MIHAEIEQCTALSPSYSMENKDGEEKVPEGEITTARSLRQISLVLVCGHRHQHQQCLPLLCDCRASFLSLLAQTFASFNAERALMGCLKEKEQGNGGVPRDEQMIAQEAANKDTHSPWLSALDPAISSALPFVLVSSPSIAFPIGDASTSTGRLSASQRKRQFGVWCKRVLQTITTGVTKDDDTSNGVGSDTPASSPFGSSFDCFALAARVQIDSALNSSVAAAQIDQFLLALNEA